MPKISTIDNLVRIVQEAGNLKPISARTSDERQTHPNSGGYLQHLIDTIPSSEKTGAREKRSFTSIGTSATRKTMQLLQETAGDPRKNQAALQEFSGLLNQIDDGIRALRMAGVTTIGERHYEKYRFATTNRERFIEACKSLAGYVEDSINHLETIQVVAGASALQRVPISGRQNDRRDTRRRRDDIRREAMEDAVDPQAQYMLQKAQNDIAQMAPDIRRWIGGHLSPETQKQFDSMIKLLIDVNHNPNDAIAALPQLRQFQSFCEELANKEVQLARPVLPHHMRRNVSRSPTLYERDRRLEIDLTWLQCLRQETVRILGAPGAATYNSPERYREIAQAGWEVAQDLALQCREIGIPCPGLDDALSHIQDVVRTTLIADSPQNASAPAPFEERQLESAARDLLETTERIQRFCEQIAAAPRAPVLAGADDSLQEIVEDPVEALNWRELVDDEEEASKVTPPAQELSEPGDAVVLTSARSSRPRVGESSIAAIPPSRITMDKCINTLNVATTHGRPTNPETLSNIARVFERDYNRLDSARREDALRALKPHLDALNASSRSLDLDALRIFINAAATCTSPELARECMLVLASMLASSPLNGKTLKDFRSMVLRGDSLALVRGLVKSLRYRDAAPAVRRFSQLLSMINIAPTEFIKALKDRSTIPSAPSQLAIPSGIVESSLVRIVFALVNKIGDDRVREILDIFAEMHDVRLPEEVYRSKDSADWKQWAHALFMGGKREAHYRETDKIIQINAHNLGIAATKHFVEEAMATEMLAHPNESSRRRAIDVFVGGFSHEGAGALRNYLRTISSNPAFPGWETQLIDGNTVRISAPSRQRKDGATL
ncbi:hypothetical protein [Burkholderia territorii]|uniref:hypothetical protein n=1 Tax=Burkholderia territorii TaxID=1503055 RepID=UPI000A7A3C51|nr:hypothetical protein [Burkholderia territorii]